MSPTSLNEGAIDTGRRTMFGAVALLAGLATAARAPAQSMTVKAGRSETSDRTSLHQQAAFAAPPSHIYRALLNSEAFAAISGFPAIIHPKAGGAFSLFGGQVVGRNIELVPDRRIVQAWRVPADFPPGVYSLVKFELAPKGSGTLLTLDQTGFPPGHFDHLNAGWGPHYWESMKKLT
jgi:activator of HSP90 ATPase